MQFLWFILLASSVWYGQTVGNAQQCKVKCTDGDVRVITVAPHAHAGNAVAITGNCATACGNKSACCVIAPHSGQHVQAMQLGAAPYGGAATAVKSGQVWVAQGEQPHIWTAQAPQPQVWVAQGQQPQVFVISDDEDQPRTAKAYAFAIADGADAQGGVEMPKLWIGIRTTDVPKALAAHIGENGVMVANVAIDSPADEAGLQQYDVIVKFAGEVVNSMADLLSAIGAVEDGENAKMVVIRGGQPTKVTIVPVERPAGGEMQFRYDEPQETIIDRDTSFWGHRVVPGPDGEWQIETLGPMPQFPTILKQLPSFKGGEYSPEDFNAIFKFDGEKFDIQKLHDHMQQLNIDGDAKIELKICVDKDGNSLTINRDADGAIRVERSAADGNVEENVYDDADALKEKDAEAYELYEKHMGGATFQWRVAAPPGDDLNDLRQRFQIHVAPRLQDALKNSAQHAQRIEIRRSGDGDEQIESKSEALSVRIDDDGAITVTVHEDGDRTVYKFDSKQSLKKEEPKLYGRVKRLLD